MEEKKVVLIGAGGHSDSVGESMLPEKIAGYIDADENIAFKSKKKIIGTNIKGVKNRGKFAYHVAIGDPKVRKKYHNELEDLNLEEANVVDDSAMIAKDCKIGYGNYVGKRVVIDADVIIGDCNIINTGAIIEHGARIGNCNNISTGAILNGDVIVGDMVFIGSNATINGQLSLGDSSVVGSGAVVTKDVKSGSVVVGVPAKPLKKEKDI